MPEHPLQAHVLRLARRLHLAGVVVVEHAVPELRHGHGRVEALAHEDPLAVVVVARRRETSVAHEERRHGDHGRADPERHRRDQRADARALAADRHAPVVGDRRRDRTEDRIGRDGLEAAAGDVDECFEMSVPDFAIESAGSVRYPMYVDTLAFRFVFIGQTAALRTFINRLAGFDLPVIVREVEAEPATLEESTVLDEPPADAAASEAPAKDVAPAKPARRASNVAPIVARPFTKFTVKRQK